MHIGHSRRFGATLVSVTTTPPSDGVRSGGFLAPPDDAEPTDRCFRCGRPVPAGVGLCDEHNPGHVRGPSSTQMHATVLIGILVGIVGFFILARLAVGSTGPYAVDIIGAATDNVGDVAVAYSILNEGESDGVADCRVTRDGVPRPDDLAFRSPSLPPADAVLFERTVAQPRNGTVSYDPDRLSIVCR